MSFSIILDTFLVSRANPRRYCRCCLTAAANPVLLVGGGMLDCRVLALVLMAGGAFLAVAVATCALVLTRVVVPSGVIARCMATTRRFLLRSRLAASVVVACRRDVGLGTLGSAAGTLGSGICTLGTCCRLFVSLGVIGSSHRCGCLCNVARVASTIRWRSFASCDVLACPVNPWMALTHSESANITLSACVMVGLVIRLC